MNYIKLTFLLISITILSGCYTFTGWGSPEDDIALLDSFTYKEETPKDTIDPYDESRGDDTPEIIEKNKLKETALGDNEGIEQAAKFYADTICIFADPNFWDGFFDGTQTQEEKNSEEERANAFYEHHGYQDETHANKGLEKHWGDDLFKDSVLENIDSRCKEAPADAGINIKDELEKPLGF